MSAATIAEEGVYYNDYHLEFIKPLYAHEKTGSSSSEYVAKAMDEIYAFIDNNTEREKDALFSENY